jgi:hypothetical protein
MMEDIGESLNGMPEDKKVKFEFVDSESTKE